MEVKKEMKELCYLKLLLYVWKWTSNSACNLQVAEFIHIKLENVFIKHYAPNHMPDPKGV